MKKKVLLGFEIWTKGGTLMLDQRSILETASRLLLLAPDNITDRADRDEADEDRENEQDGVGNRPVVSVTIVVMVLVKLFDGEWIWKWCFS